MWTKVEKKLKVILCIALISLIVIVSFVGVYTKKDLSYKNSLPNYNLNSELSEKRLTSLSVGITEEHIHDKDGNEVDAIPEGANKEDYTIETTEKNKQEDLTKENYQKSREVLINRLEDLGVQEYFVRVDENNGNTTLELPESKDTDAMMTYLLGKGNFSIVDSKDSTKILLDKSDIKSARLGYNNASGLGTTVVLSIKFNKEGTKKLADISREYKEGNEYEKTEEDGDKNSEEKSEEKSNQKEVSLVMNGSTLFSTHFDEELTTGESPLSLGTATKTEDLQTYLRTGTFYSMFLNNDDLPLTFDIDDVKTVHGNISENGLEVVIAVISIIFVISAIYMIVRFKLDGIIAGIAEIAGLRITFTNSKIYKYWNFTKFSLCICYTSNFKFIFNNKNVKENNG